MVSTPRSGRAARAAAAFATPLVMLLVGATLVAGVAGGLLRADAAPAAWRESALLGQAAVGHAALMLSAFLGTVIAIERAVALRLRVAFVAPLASGLGGVLLVAGEFGSAAWLGVLGAATFVGVNIVLVRREPAGHTLLLLAGALAWLTGSLLFALGRPGSAVVPWWFAFVVLTIAAERLEMTRLLRRRPGARPTLLGIVVGLLVGAALSAPSPHVGGVVFGGALAALATWLATFDIARRTVHAHGLSRYMALCLLCGYAWLGVAGLAWAATAAGAPAGDAALHALGLGFIVSMVMGHAPVILPAVAGIRVRYGPWFYLPLGLLHTSLLWRLAGGAIDADWRAPGAALNAAALALFVVTVAASAIAAHGGRRKPCTERPA